MKNLQQAMNEEAAYIADRLSGKNTSLIDRLIPYGYNDLESYFTDKKNYLFEQWIPEVFYVDEDWLNNKMEPAIANGEYGIYIISPKSEVYAFHGTDEIDIEECENFGVKLIEMHYNGGTIIGSAEDFGIMIVAPADLMLTGDVIMSNFLNIIKQYIPEVEINGNDIILNGEKIMGSMQRHIERSYVWAAQFSFIEHNNII